MMLVNLAAPQRSGVVHVTKYSWADRLLGFAIRGGDGGTPPPFMPGNAGLLLAGKIANVTSKLNLRLNFAQLRTWPKDGMDLRATRQAFRRMASG